MHTPKTNNIGRLIVMALTHTQLQLEIMDDIKMTKLYRHSLKRNLNALERDLEKLLTGELAEAYIQDEEQFRILGQHIEYIVEWIAESDFDDILSVGKALKDKDIVYQEESVVEDKSCNHDKYKSFQSGYKQCIKCGWIWKD
jgi:hypothetical protein